MESLGSRELRIPPAPEQDTLSRLEIWIVRHAAARDRETWRLDDAMRPLTERGRDRFRTLVARLGGRVKPPSLIWTSPAVRAVQTAELLAGLEGFRGTVEVAPWLSPEGDVPDAVSAASELVGRRMAVVGHEPLLSVLAGRLLGLRALPCRLPKGAVVAIADREVVFAALPRRAREKHGRILRSLEALCRAAGDPP